MTAYEREQAARAERARMVGLFRYALIREAAHPERSKRDRGEMVRQLAANEHIGPFGEPVRISRPTIDRWIRAWRGGGFEALLPPLRQVSPRTRVAWRKIRFLDGCRLSIGGGSIVEAAIIFDRAGGIGRFWDAPKRR